MTLNLISDTTVPLVCVMGCFYGQKRVYAVLFTWREMHADISVCVCVAPAAGPGGDWTSQTGHPSWDELNYSGRNLTPFNIKC